MTGLSRVTWHPGQPSTVYCSGGVVITNTVATVMEGKNVDSETLSGARVIELCEEISQTDKGDSTLMILSYQRGWNNGMLLFIMIVGIRGRIPEVADQPQALSQNSPTSDRLIVQNNRALRRDDKDETTLRRLQHHTQHCL